MTKTDAENAPSDALTAWRKAFFTRNVKAFAEGFAQNVVLEASALRKSVEGRDRVRQMLWTAAEIYESLVFTDQASSGQRISIEWGATAFGGKQLRGSTILVTNEEGKIDHAVVQHRPLDGLLAGAGVIVALMGAVAVAATLAWAADARVIVIRASLVLVVGVGVTVLAVALGRWPLRRQGAGRPRLRSGVLRGLPQPGTTGPAEQARRAPRFDLHRRLSRLRSSSADRRSRGHPLWPARHDLWLRSRGDGPGRDDGACDLAPQGPLRDRRLIDLHAACDRPVATRTRAG
jgi:hypothetical protein